MIASAAHARSWLTLMLLFCACTFDPKVRPLDPEQLSSEHVQVLGTLDARGEFALLAVETDSGELKGVISKWRKGQRCEVPVLGTPLATPLPRPTHKAGPVLYAPLTIDTAPDVSELALVDESCVLYGPYGAVQPATVRTFFSRIDNHAFLVFRDPDNTLSVLDPYVSLVPRPLAAEVTALRLGVSSKEPERDVLWLIEAGRITQRTLEGKQLLALGRDVSSMTLDSEALRVAYVDDGDLYEAVAPRFKPNLLEQDACAPRYSRGTLQFFAPCEEEKLMRVRLSNSEYESFEEGVFASSVQDGIQLDYVRDEDDAPQLVAAFPDDARIPVTPSLQPGAVYVLDEQRIAGLDATAHFGVWDRRDETFSPMFSDVSDLVSSYRGRTHSYRWLIYHDVVDGLGRLSLLNEDGMVNAEIARGVPPSERQGFLVEDGSALPHYPFAAPLVVLLEDAQALPQGGRFRGRLKALSMTGDPSAELAEGVSSYVLVASPAPGVLYGVEDGPGRGLWYTPL